MEQEFTLSKYWKAFYGIVATGAGSASIFLLTKLSSAKSPSALIALSVVFLIFGIIMALYILRRKVVLSKNSISVSGILGTREFANNEVKGFRLEAKAILIFSNTECVRRIMINDYDSIGNSNALINELTERYPDLDAIDYQAGLSDILQSDELGLSEDERMNSLRSAGRLAFIYNIFGLVVFIGSIFFVDALIASDLYSVVLIIYPLVGLLLMATQKGLIKFATKKTSPLYSLYYSMFMSCVFLVGKPLVKYSLIDFSTAWFSIGGVAVVFFGLLYWKGKADAASAVKGHVVAMFLVALAYGFGFAIMVNCMFDTTKPQIFTAKIEKVYITTGKRTIYNVTVAPWGPVHKSKSIQVAETVFYRLTVGNDIGVELRPGLFSMPWYQLNI